MTLITLMTLIGVFTLEMDDSTYANNLSILALIINMGYALTIIVMGVSSPNNPNNPLIALVTLS